MRGLGDKRTILPSPCFGKKNPICCSRSDEILVAGAKFEPTTFGL